VSNFFLAIAIASSAVAVIQSFFDHSRTSQRRIYWSCVGIAAMAGFFMVYPDWKKGLGLGLFFLSAMTVVAFAYTPYIKLGGKTRALTVQDSRSDSGDTPTTTSVALERDPTPDAYSGIVSAAKMWWLLVGLLVISAGNFYAFVAGRGEVWVAAIGIGFVVFLAVVTGYGDASWGYAIARGQRPQFAIATVTTAGAFAVLYLFAYYTGKHMPLRRKQSMEYRAHPRHAEREQ
jgi:hypothetical protein